MPSQRTRSGPARGLLPPTLSLLVVATCASAGSLACAKKAPPSLDVSSPQSSPESIPDAPLSGKVRGAAFKLADARYYVDQRRGFEKIDILLGGAAAADRCGPTNPVDGPAVWLRHLGAQKIEPEKASGKPRQPSPWEVHYQVRDKEGWVGNGDSAYLLVIRAVRPDKTIVGDLSVCFADHEKSCVSGSFEAFFCPIAIDAPVRGTEQAEPIPAKWVRKPGASASVAPAPSDGAAPSGSPSTMPSASTSASNAAPKPSASASAPAGGTR